MRFVLVHEMTSLGPQKILHMGMELDVANKRAEKSIRATQKVLCLPYSFDSV